MDLSTVWTTILFISLGIQRGLTQLKSRRDTQENNLKDDPRYPLMLRIIKQGGRLGLEECRAQFQNEIWDCSLENAQAFKRMPIFVKTTLRTATRETAFVHAISAAAITHEITNQCRKSRIPGCRCAQERKAPVRNQDWQWGGCDDHVKFGENQTRRFIDNLEKGKGARRAFNLHNNEIGRKVTRANLRRECKCHGLSATCQLKTCWKRLAPFSVVGSELKRRYQNAVHVLFKDRKLQVKITENQYKPVSRKDKQLVYLESSPDYCVRNLTAGSKGMLGRKCSSDDMPTQDCKALCNSCKLKHQTEDHYEQVKCRCRFVWCCSITCETCTKQSTITTCKRG